MKKRPAIISVDKGRVQALDLVEKDGLLAVPIDRGHRYVGDLFQERVNIDGLTPKRWFAQTLVGANLGPFTSKQEALERLLDYTHIRAADVSETTAPLF